jgi:hypothetical protein
MRTRVVVCRQSESVSAEFNVTHVGMFNMWPPDAWVRICPRDFIFQNDLARYSHIALTPTPPSLVLLRDAHGIYHVLADDQQASLREP